MPLGSCSTCPPCCRAPTPARCSPRARAVELKLQRRRDSQRAGSPTRGSCRWLQTTGRRGSHEQVGQRVDARPSRHRLALPATQTSRRSSPCGRLAAPSCPSRSNSSQQDRAPRLCVLSRRSAILGASVLYSDRRFSRFASMLSSSASTFDAPTCDRTCVADAVDPRFPAGLTLCVDSKRLVGVRISKQ